MKVCIIADAKHIDVCQQEGIPYKSVEDLKKLNKNKKLVKQLAASFDAFLASQALIKQIPRILGPGLNKAGKFPGLLSHDDSMTDKVNNIKQTIKFQMKKVLTLGVAIGHVNMERDDIVMNASVFFLHVFFHPKLYTIYLNFVLFFCLSSLFFSFRPPLKPSRQDDAGTPITGSLGAFFILTCAVMMICMLLQAVTSVNFLVSLLKKNWQNVRSLNIKSTMGPVQRLY